MFKKVTGVLFFCLALTQCSETTDLMNRPIHKTDNAFQNEEHRLLPMDGAHNTRELGGYKTNEGKSVKWGMLFRSDKLSDISKADQEYLQNLGLDDFHFYTLNRSDLTYSILKEIKANEIHEHKSRNAKSWQKERIKIRN